MCKCQNSSAAADALSEDLAEAQAALNQAQEWNGVLMGLLLQYQEAIASVREALNPLPNPRPRPNGLTEKEETNA